MEEIKDLKKELSRLDDMIDMIELKIHNLVGLLELVYLGIRGLNHIEDSYEMCSVILVQSYLETIERTDIRELHEKIDDLKERA